MLVMEVPLSATVPLRVMFTVPGLVTALAMAISWFNRLIEVTGAIATLT